MTKTLMKLDTGKNRPKHRGKNKNRPPWYGMCNNLRPELLIVWDVISDRNFLKGF